MLVRPQGTKHCGWQVVHAPTGTNLGGVIKYQLHKATEGVNMTAILFTKRNQVQEFIMVDSSIVCATAGFQDSEGNKDVRKYISMIAKGVQIVPVLGYLTSSSVRSLENFIRNQVPLFLWEGK